MNEEEVKKLLNTELSSLDTFKNYHGVTRENLKQFIVSPYKVLVDPDDQETEERYMWVVLKVSEQSLIAIDPLEKLWLVLNPLQGGRFIQTICEETLAEALDGM